MEGALRERLATVELHHYRGRDRAIHRLHPCACGGTVASRPRALSPRLRGTYLFEFDTSQKAGLSPRAFRRLYLLLSVFFPLFKRLDGSKTEEERISGPTSPSSRRMSAATVRLFEGPLSARLEGAICYDLAPHFGPFIWPLFEHAIKAAAYLLRRTV